MPDDAFIKELLSKYGEGYEAPTAAGDPNSLGYALRGPAPPVDTSNVLGAMGARQAAREREGPEAAANLIATLAGAGIGAGAARGARPIPQPGARNLGDRVGDYVDAARLHQRRETNNGNPHGFLEGLGTFGGSSAAAATAALTGHPELAALLTSAALMTRPTKGGVFMGDHMRDISNIYDHLAQVRAREAAKQLPPDNSGFTLSADTRPATAVNRLVEQSQRLPAGVSIEKNPKRGMNDETFYDAMKEGEIAARLKVHPDHSVGNVWVEPPLQRQGIASALYDYAAKDRGIPHLGPGSYQTPEGRALRAAYMKRLLGGSQ